jgi:hypothetical protein
MGQVFGTKVVPPVAVGDSAWVESPSACICLEATGGATPLLRDAMLRGVVRVSRIWVNRSAVNTFLVSGSHHPELVSGTSVPVRKTLATYLVRMGLSTKGTKDKLLRLSFWRDTY